MVRFKINHSWIHISLIIILGLMIFLPRLDTLPFRGEEPRRVVSAFEIKQSGQWVVPTIQHQVFLSRPPLQNWVIAATATIRHTFDHLSGRLPSVLSTLLTALMIYFYSVTRLSKTTALMASLFFLTMPQVIQLGLTAETELMFTFLLSSAFLLWHKGELSGWPDVVKWLLAYFFLALATLTKGINQAPIYFALIIGTHLLFHRKIRTLFQWGHLLGLLLFIFVVGSWQRLFIEAVGFKTGWLMHFGDVGLRFQSFEKKDYLQHVLLFPWELLAMMLPWSLLIFPLMSKKFWKANVPQSARSLAIFCMSAIFVTIWTIWYPAGARARYYMPLYPCFAILAAISATSIQEAMNHLNAQSSHWWGRLLSLFRVIGMVGIPLIGIGFLLSYLLVFDLPQLTHSLIHAVIFFTASMIIGLFLYKFSSINEAHTLLNTIFAYTLFVIFFVNFIYVDSRIEKLNQVEESVRQVLQSLPEKTQLISFGGADFDFLYYYMREMGDTMTVISKEDLLKMDEPLYFCMRSTSSKFIDKNEWDLIDKVPTGRYKPAQTNGKNNHMIVARLKRPYVAAR